MTAVSPASGTGNDAAMPRAFTEIPTLAPRGEVDMASCRTLAVELGELAGQAGDAVLDLSGVTLLDSTGLAGLLAFARDVHQAGGTLATITPHGSEGRLVIDMAGVGEILGLREQAPGAR